MQRSSSTPSQLFAVDSYINLGWKASTSWRTNLMGDGMTMWHSGHQFFPVLGSLSIVWHLPIAIKVHVHRPMISWSAWGHTHQRHSVCQTCRLSWVTSQGLLSWYAVEYSGMQLNHGRVEIEYVVLTIWETTCTTGWDCLDLIGWIFMSTVIWWTEDFNLDTPFTYHDKILYTHRIEKKIDWWWQITFP